MNEAATEGTSVPSETATQAQSVQGELDALISEGKQQQPDLSKDIKRVVSYVEEQQVEKANEQFRTDMDSAVKAVEEVLPEEARRFLTSDLIEGQLYKLAEDDAAVKKAFLERGTNPDAWLKARDGIVGDFKERYKEVPDTAINEDREAVMAAAKSAGKSTEGEEMTLGQIDTMRKTEPAKWQALQKKHGVTPYGV